MMSYKIVNGYYDQYNNVHLVVLNDKGKFIKTISGHVPYIYISAKDYENPVLKSKLEEWKKNRIIYKVLADTNPNFKKVTLTQPSNAYEVRRWLQSHKITPYEADIPYVRRVMIDKLTSVGDKKLRKLFLDIETDDSLHGIEIGRDRILSIGLMDEFGKKWFLTGNTERELLVKFRNVIEKYDLLLTWYGERFDFPYIEMRCKRCNVWIDWRKYQRVDFYEIYKRSRQQQLAGGYNLDNVGAIELGLKKIERTEKIITLYTTNLKKLEVYNMRDVEIMVKLEEKLHLIDQQESLAEMANIFIQQVSGTAVLDTLILRKVVEEKLPYRFKCKNWQSDGEYQKGKQGYKGAFVVPPTPGLHRNVLYIDFKSLYDSIARSFNICFTTIDPKGKINTPAGLCSFTNTKRGLLPQMMEMMAKKDQYLKNKILESEAKGDKKEIHKFKLQRLPIKFMLKSFYGQMGSSYSRYYDKRLAESITTTGQWLIKETIKEVELLGYKIISGDTDGVGVKIPENFEPKHTGEKLAEHLNDCYQRWLKRFNPWENLIRIKFEGIYEQLILIGDEDDPTKKRYAGKLIWDEGVDVNQIIYKGIEAIRSDWGEYAKNLQKEIINMIFESKSAGELSNHVIIIRDFVVDKNLKKEDLILFKGLSKKIGSYDDKGKPVHVKVAEDMIERGMDVWAGSKIPYIIVDGDKKLEAIYSEDYAGDYDEKYYWNKQIYPPSYRILRSVFPQQDWGKFIIDRKINGFTQTRDQKSLSDWF